MSTTATREWSAVEYGADRQGDWDDIVRRARQGHFLFERRYMDYHSDRFEDVSLILEHRGAAVAALPLCRVGADAVSHAGLTFGGLLTDTRMTTPRVLDALDAAAVKLRSDGFRRLVYKPVPHLYHLQPAEDDLFWLARVGARLDRRDLSSALCPARPAGYSKERIRGVRYGAEAGIAIAESDALEEFMTLLRDVLLARHQVEPVHTAAEMRLLADRFPGRIRLFEAREGPDLVAGVLMYETDRVAHAQYIGASERGRAIRAQDALFDKLLTDVYARHPWFDFGISTEADRSLNEGLVRYKEGFGARPIVHDRWVVELR